jgi:hypothetical protein
MESFNGKLRDECLNEHVFSSLAEPFSLNAVYIIIPRNSVSAHIGGASASSLKFTLEISLRSPSINSWKT